ncbi:MAG: hypothetical protein A2176_11575 [Spirochaetes bacterium RBG_13_51_14]|nr:MAG: hypothetical protein A2176_11575 [Spirochaetes bacterium RBG_13_51_14]
MNEIDNILSNIDKDEDDDLFPEPHPEGKKNDEIDKLIDTIDTAAADAEAAKAADDLIPIEPAAEPEPAGEHDDALEPETAETVEASEVTSKELYTVPGTKSWNRREPYVIRLDPDALMNDRDGLRKSFYFVEEPSDQETIKQKIKQEIVAYLRRPTEHVTERYGDFIYKNTITMMNDIAGDFKLDEDTHRLFIYHTGPLTVFRYIKEAFYRKKYGYCYQYLPGNKAARFFPEEFIKENVLRWFEENINTLSLPFDSIQKYEEIKKIVSHKYHGDLRIFNARLDQLNEKAGRDKTVSRHRLFMIKGAEWFGQINIEVYKRFLGSAIFM